MLIIGVTGGIASGKTTVVKQFKRLGAIVIDADRIAHEIIVPHTRTWQRIVKAFGKDIINRSYVINRKKLGELVFSDTEKLIKLNSITHPVIIKEIKKRIKYIGQKHEDCVIILEMPLLFETNLTSLVDIIVVVKVSRKIQIARLIQRNKLNLSQAKARIKSQIPIRRKAEQADYVISGEALITQIRARIQNILKESHLIIRHKKSIKFAT